MVAQSYSKTRYSQRNANSTKSQKWTLAKSFGLLCYFFLDFLLLVDLLLLFWRLGLRRCWRGSLHIFFKQQLNLHLHLFRTKWTFSCCTFLYCCFNCGPYLVVSGHLPRLPLCIAH